MGTDWSPHIERQMRNGSWRYYKKVCYCEKAYKDATREQMTPREAAMHSFKQRHYWLFAVIANVRNGLGVRPIFANRGMPEDVSPGVKRASDEYDGYGHTYFTVRELLEFDWYSEALQHEFYLNAVEYEEWIARGRQGLIEDCHLDAPDPGVDGSSRYDIAE